MFGPSLCSDIDDFIVTELGYRYRIVTEGTGRVPTVSDCVKVDHIGWDDAFDGQVKCYDYRGVVNLVSDLFEWYREAMLSMREGEVRQIRLPPGYGAPYLQLRLVSIE